MPDFTAWQFTFLALPQAAAAALAGGACWVVWRRRRTSHLGFSLWLLLLAQTFWAGAGALEFLSADVPAKILLTQISYVGIVLGPLSLLYFAYGYITDGAAPPAWLRRAAACSAGLILLVAWSNAWHGLLWPDVTAVQRGEILFARYERGPFFWFTVAYCYGLMLLSSVLLIRHTLRIGGVFGRQSLLILFATLAPWLTSLTYVLRLGPMPELDHTPVGFVVTGLLLALSVMRFRLFELSPIPAETLFNRVPDPILVIDRADRLVRANASAFERFRLSPIDLGEPLATVLRGQTDLVAALAGRNDPRWKNTVEAAGVCWEVESGPASRRAGSRLVLLRDITEQKNAERRLAHALAQAESLRREADTANAAKSTFLAQVSHDLRTPLHAILGLSELMLAGPLDDRLRADANTIRDAGGILLRLINDLLDLSRIEAGRIELVYEPFALEETLAPVVDLLAVKARAKGLELRHRIDPALPSRLCGDMDRLRQILFNLAGNAVKFTTTGSVAIELLPADDAAAICIHISDTGPGIPAGRLPSVFEPFDRGDASSVRRIEGTGLGLAISRRLALAMGGDISVQSAVGRGTTFTLRLPVIDAHAPPETPGLRTVPAVASSASRPTPSAGAAPASPSLAREIQPRRVLLADDQEISRRVSGALFKACGCQVVTVNDGPEALARAASEGFDLIVLDGQMGELDGWDVARRIRAGLAGPVARELPVIALTADLSAEARRLWLDAGATIVLGKPSSVDTLADALSRLAAIGAPDARVIAPAQVSP